MGPRSPSREDRSGVRTGARIVMLVLDSSFVIDHLRGEPGAAGYWRRVFEMGDEPIATEIMVCEVRAGLRAADEAQLWRFLEPVEFIQPAADAAMQAGRWRSELRAEGRTLSLADALIAAAAHALDAAVLTRNVHDFALAPVRVETY
jgi:predicted nucleic acid-binding protein